MAPRVFRRHALSSLVPRAFPRHLTTLDLTLLGLGSIVGAGIFVLTGQAAAEHAGPAVVLSFVLAGAAAGCSALCYAELGGVIPLSGSAYVGIC